MVVQLHSYVVWLRGGEKALLLSAVIASCIGIFINGRLQSNVHDTNRYILRLYWAFTLAMIILLVIYLVISEPSPLSVLFPDQFVEVPGSRGLQIEGLVIIFLILVPFGGALAGIRIETISRHLPIYIISFCIVCICVRFISFIYYACGSNFTFAFQTCHVGIADIGGTTLNAVHAVQKGINPYTIDIQGNYTNSPYRGYRYWPMMFAVYMPLVSLFTTGWGAMRLTNLALDVITAALILVLVRRRSGWFPGVLGASLYLMLPMLPMRLYGMADTDLAPTVLVLAALALHQTRPGLAGAMVGLSVSAKFFPGLLMLVCCFPESGRPRYLGGFILGLIPAIAFCLFAPWDFIYNTVSPFVATDPTVDDSSWLYGAPSYVISTTRLVFILLMAAVSFVMIWRPPNFLERCVLYVVCVVALLLASHAHNNYMLWWIPVFCILLSSPLSRILSLPGSPANTAGSGTRSL